MPKSYKRRYGKKRTKKRTFKRKSYKRRKLYQRGQMSGLPVTKRVTMRYCEHIQNIHSVLGSIGVQVFRCNSIYDPNYTGGGHQPMGHDFWATTYNHYMVTGATITVKMVPNTGVIAPCMGGIYVTDGSGSPYNTPSSYIEAKRGIYRVFNGSEGKPVTMKYKFNTKKFFNVKDVKDNTTRLGAPFGANPTEDAYFNVWFLTLDLTNGDVNAIITIDYNVVMGEPQDMVPS